MTRSLSEVRGTPSKRQQFLTVAGMIAAVDSVVIGLTDGLLVGMIASSPMVASPIAVVTGAGTSLVVHLLTSYEFFVVTMGWPWTSSPSPVPRISLGGRT